MANILLTLSYKVYPDSEHISYQQVRGLCLESYRANLLGQWKEVTLCKDYTHRGATEGLNLMWQEMFLKTMDLCLEGYNVLYVDTDTLCVKPTEIFGRWDDIMMFWPTDPREGFGFDPYLNGGVVYAPASTPRDRWSVVPDRVKHFREWNDSQILWNRLYYGGSGPSHGLHPELNWQYCVDSTIPENEAHILHFNTTRGVESALEHMQEVWCR